MKILDLHALVYRYTGVMTPYAKSKMYEHIFNQAEDIYNAYLHNRDTLQMPFQEFMDLQVFVWKRMNNFKNKNDERVVLENKIVRELEGKQ